MTKVLIVLYTFLFTSTSYARMKSELVYKIADSTAKISSNFDKNAPKTGMLGSGLVISPNHIITNSHVVTSKGYEAEKITAVISGVKHEMELMAASPLADLALLKIKKTALHTPKEFKYFIDIFKNSNLDPIKPFSKIHAFGFPLTDILTRQEGHFLTSNFPINDMIPYNAISMRRFHHGISGGPVFNDSGKLLGISTLKNEKDELLFTCTGKPVVGLLVEPKTVVRFVDRFINREEEMSLYRTMASADPKHYPELIKKFRASNKLIEF